MLCWAAGHNEPRSTKPEIGGSGSDVRDTAAACGSSTVAASGGTDACGNPGNLVQIRARLRDVIVLINRRRQTMSLVAHTSELQPRARRQQ